MDITVYLPDEIGTAAKEADLNLSRMLRDAVSDELERRKAMAEALEQAEEIRFDFEDRDGRVVTGRVTGKWLTQGVILAEDERIIIVDDRKLRFWEVEGDPKEALRDLLEEDEYIDAMIALGITPIVDI